MNIENHHIEIQSVPPETETRTTLPTRLTKRFDTTLRLAFVAMLIAAGLALPTVGSSMPQPSQIPTGTDRNAIITTRIAAEQSGQVKDFFKEYVAFVNLEDVLVISDQVYMHPLQTSKFSQKSLIYPKNEPSSEPIGTLLSNYDRNGSLIGHELVADMTKVNFPEINSNIDDVIAKEGRNSRKLADSYEELLRRAINLPPGTDCSEIENIWMREEPFLSVSCWQRYEGWDVQVLTKADGSIGVYVSDPVGYGSCGIG